MARSVVALLAGFAILTFTVLVATLVAAMFMDVNPQGPSANFQMVNIAYTTLAAHFGGYATASLARDRRVGHTMVLALMIVVMQAFNIMNPQQGYPRMHFVVLLVTCAAAAVSGGKVREFQLNARVPKP